MVPLSAANLESFKGQQFSIVMIGAPWCGPCKVNKPALEELSLEMSFPFGYIDADLEPDLVKSLGVRSVPTIRIFRHSKQLGEIMGMRSKEQLRSVIHMSGLSTLSFE